MSLLFLEAYWQLARFDPVLARGSFARLYEKVRRCPTTLRPAASPGVEEISSAIDLACIWYWKKARCLQRSAATTCLLRRYGVPAQMVLGAQPMPFKAHAWVEVRGQVVNDKSYIRDIYPVLDRC